MKKMSFRFLSIVFLIGLTQIFLGCSSSEKESEQTAQEISEPIDSIIIVLKGQTGKSVFDIVREQHEVGFLESSMGVFVNAIDSLETRSKCGWMYSVNDSMGQVASDKYITHDSDIIKWHYRKY